MTMGMAAGLWTSSPLPVAMAFMHTHPWLSAFMAMATVIAAWFVYRILAVILEMRRENQTAPKLEPAEAVPEPGAKEDDEDDEDEEGEEVGLPGHGAVLTAAEASRLAERLEPVPEGYLRGKTIAAVLARIHAERGVAVKAVKLKDHALRIARAMRVDPW